MDKYNSLDSFISTWAAKTPKAIAIKSERDGEQISYAELDTLINLLCHSYEDRIKKGAIVALLMDDSIICHAMLHMVFRLGGIVTPVDSELGEFLLANILGHACPELVLVADGNGKAAFLVGNEDYSVEVFDNKLASYTPKFAADVEVVASRASAEDKAMVAYTSGTTSNAKGVLLSHGNLIAAYKSGTDNMYAPTVVGCVFRIASLGTIGIHYFFAQYSGATTVLLPRLELRTLSTFWERHVANKVDFVYIVPSLVKLLNHFGKVPETKPIGIVVSAGSFLPVDQQEKFQDKFGVCMLNIYGMTESSFAVFFGAAENGRGKNCIGKARSLIAMVVDENGVEVPDGEPGELWYKGDMVSSFGYLKNPEATAQTYRDGWLVTGDIVVRNEAGEITITGRKKDIIIRGGFNVFPAEVEDALLEESLVVNSYVMGNPNEVMGEEILAFVQVRQLNPEEETRIVERVRKRLGPVKAPDRYHFSTSEVPLNPAGKVDRRAVLAYFITSADAAAE